jgi:glycosyltransferase involved in cell wall biosynthesis
MKQKILICNPFISLGGIGTFTITLACGLGRKQDQVCFLATHYKGDLWDNAEYAFNKSYTLEKIKNPFLKIIKVIKLINILRPDAIIINDCPIVNYALPFIDNRIKVISVIHSDAKRYYLLGTCFSGWINKIICPSEKLSQRVLSFLPGTDYNKVRFIPHGIELPLIDNNQKKISNSVIFIGNLDSHKGVLLLPEIMKLIKEHVKNVRFFIVGKGPLKDWLIDEIRLKDLSTNVRFFSEMTKADIYSQLAIVEILLMPTRLESFGLVIPEAMASGVVPVVSYLEQITDQFIKNGENGFLCDRNDPKEFSERIIQILSQQELKTSLSIKARETAQDSFSEDRMIYHYMIETNDKEKINKTDPFTFAWYSKFIKNIIIIIKNIYREDKHIVY